MRSAADRPRDPGLAPERTALAWQRMALGFTTLAGLAVALAARREAPWMLAPAALLFVVGATVWVYARRRARWAGRPPADHPGAGAWLAAATVLAAVLAAVLAVAPRD